MNPPTDYTDLLNTIYDPSLDTPAPGLVWNNTDTSGFNSVPIDTSGTVQPGGDTGSFGTTPDVNSGISGALSSLTNSAKTIFGNIVGGQTGTVYDSYGVPVTAANPATAQIGNVANSLTSIVTSFLPLILIGGVLLIVFKIATGHRR